MGRLHVSHVVMRMTPHPPRSPGLLRSFTKRNPLLVAGICFIGGLIIGMLVGATVALREKEVPTASP